MNSVYTILVGNSVKESSSNISTRRCSWQLRQGNRWKRGMLPKCLLSIKGRSCNQTPFVHQDMTMHFLLLTYMYVPSFISIPFILSKIRHRQESIINQINDYGEITLSIYRIGLSFWCTALSLNAIYLNQVSFWSVWYFPRYGQ